MKKMVLCAIVPALLVAVVPYTALAQNAAQNYPTRVVRILVGYSPGGSMDVTARYIADRLKDTLGQQVLVENRPGVGGSVAAQALLRPPLDGHTMMLAGGATLAIPLKIKISRPYDAARDFAPVIHVVNLPLMLVVPTALPVKSIKEFLALARSRPGALSFGSSGVGSTTHLSGEMLKSLAKIDMVHVPYKGSSQMILDLLSGQVGMAFDQITTAGPHVANGKLRALAISTARRTPLAPNLPTLAESGVPKYESASWNGFVLPAGAPKQAVERLQRDIDAILKEPDMIKKLAEMGADPVGGTSQQFAAHLQAEGQRWGELITRLGIEIK